MHFPQIYTDDHPQYPMRTAIIDSIYDNYRYNRKSWEGLLSVVCNFGTKYTIFISKYALINFSTKYTIFFLGIHLLILAPNIPYFV